MSWIKTIPWVEFVMRYLSSFVNPELMVPVAISMESEVMSEASVFQDAIILFLHEDTVVANVIVEIPFRVHKAFVLWVNPETMTITRVTMIRGEKFTSDFVSIASGRSSIE